MSLKSWKDEFYPKEPTKRMTKVAALKHSIQKWTGLLPKNLEKHNLNCNFDYGRIEEDAYYDDEESLFQISCDSCALCVNFESATSFDCEKCPLFIKLGNKRCDYMGKSPYRVWRDTGDPKPMLRALKATLKKVEAGEI